MLAFPYGKKVAVLGLGKSGFESAVFLLQKGFRVFASEKSDSPEMQAKASALRKQGAQAETGSHSDAQILSSDWVIISPGIPPSAPIYRALNAANVPTVSEIEAAFLFSPDARVIAVTGTSGKTTVTTLIAKVIEAAGRRAVLCGNIGTPWISQINHSSPDEIIVLEVSSFQLQNCFRFNPWIGILLNLSANHQDWHADMAEYAGAKLRMFQNQSREDFCIIRKQDEHYFPKGFSFRGRRIYPDEPVPGGKENVLLNPNESVVLHTARILGMPDEIVHNVLSRFEGIEHRLEFVRTVSGVNFINDSKCTSTASLLWGLQKFSDQSVVLIAGGHPKANDFHEAGPLIRKKCRKVILIGEARPLMRKSWQGICPIDETDNFKEAVEGAFRAAVSQNVVLLSPACASFDMFRNYEERGKIFKGIVSELSGKPGPLVSNKTLTQ